MSIRSVITSAVSARLFSEAELIRRRTAAERRRRKAGAPHVVEYFHRVDDPYAQLTAQVLGEFTRRFEVELRPWLCSPPPDWAAPDRQRLVSHSRIDAERLAKRAGLTFTNPGAQPEPVRVAEAESRLSRRLERGTFIEEAAAIGAALWSGEAFGGEAPSASLVSRRREGDARRERLGHYLDATFYYGGEWYWGVDRLHYLEARLGELGARREGAPDQPIFPPPVSPDPARPPAPAGGHLDFFLSFRSPYTYIVTERAKALADAHGAELRLRYVLPMVMRGMKVPASKRGYISMDAAREARRLGVPFGRIADPLGRPVERGYSLLPWAIEQGAGHAYCLSFMGAVWSEGVDAGETAGLRWIVEQAGLDWSAARPRLDGDGWRAEAERNRQELLELGLWGVPCFRYGSVATWGQDRLWVIEDEMRAHAARRN